MSAIKFDLVSYLRYQNLLKVLQLPPAKRRQLLAGVARELKRNSIRNIRAQKSPDGKPWAPRKKENKKKMLRNMPKVARRSANANFAEVFYKGRVAFEQHEGYTKLMNAAEMAKENPSQSVGDKSPATRQQAKALRDEDFMVRVKGKKKWRKPSLKWIQQNLHVKQAGLILRALRTNGQPDRFGSWVTTIPARRFLGFTYADVNNIVNKIFDNTIKSRA